MPFHRLLFPCLLVGCGAAAPAPPAAPAPVVQLGPGASLGGARLLPVDNPWNQDISAVPVDPNSAVLLRSIGWDRPLHPDFGAPWEGRPNGIPYVVVPGTQFKVGVRFESAEESDSGPYPIPPNPPIEGGDEADGDRHVIVLDRDNWLLYELFDAHFEPAGWRAGSGAIFDLRSNQLRPAGHTSADAAGLPILPGLVRYDEVHEDGRIDHALRFTAPRTRRAYLPPATHWASAETDPDLPPMGLRARLKSSFRIPAEWPAEAKVILQALQTYGMLLADNGSPWYLSGAPDPRWDDEALAYLKRVKGSDFEVVEMRGMVTP